MIRKIFSLVFAGLILFNLFGYYFVFRCDQLRTKSEMKAMIRNGSFAGFTREIIVNNPSTNPDFKMLEKGEFRYRGKMYDVISVRVSGNSLIFRCVNDIREERIVARLEKFTSLLAGMNVPEKNKNSQALLHHIIKHALVENYSITVPGTCTIERFFNHSCSFTSVIITPPPPPPWSA
jgi:hypothetical protein